MDDGASSYHRFLNGDEKAFEEIVMLYSDSLVCFAYCFVHDSETAEDIAADTFAALLVKRRRFAPKALFKTYLYRIARNKCMDYLRKARKFCPLNDAETLLSSDSEREFFRRERDRKLYLCMQNLPAQYRDVLYLVYIDGFSVPEVCTIMGKNAKQVYNLLARAKAELKKLLINEGLDENL